MKNEYKLIRGFSAPDEERSVDSAREKIFRCVARDRTVVPGHHHHDYDDNFNGVCGDDVNDKAGAPDYDYDDETDSDDVSYLKTFDHILAILEVDRKGCFVMKSGTNLSVVDCERA